MQPLLKIQLNGMTVRKIEVNGLKEALKLVETMNNLEHQTIVYSTVNEKTRIENTVTIQKRN